VTNGIPLGRSLLLPVGTVNSVQTLKGEFESIITHYTRDKACHIDHLQLTVQKTGIYSKRLVDTTTGLVTSTFMVAVMPMSEAAVTMLTDPTYGCTVPVFSPWILPC
jgi:hypothetical protein